MNSIQKQPLYAGFTLVEVLVAALILVIGIVAVYSAVLWGKYYTKKNEYVVTAAHIGRDKMEVIKAFGIYNANDTTAYTVYNPATGTYAVDTVIHPRHPSSADTSFEIETIRSDDTTTGITTFTCHVYLYGRPTTDPKFRNPICSYQTQMSIGGI
ncbi:MAG: prepilin-type N-terminal cleavage/methylation domain-containing protein [bacterium]|nr:prepilin-type N-terminal cleavage/methylation domain-containing protein [bacterium]